MRTSVDIPFFSHTREFEAHREEFLDALEACVRSPTLILGERGRECEACFARSCGATHGIGVASGTDAIILALKALGIGAGDEVVTVANTAVPTVAAIRLAGAMPRFVDIDPKTLLMDTTKVESVVTKKTKALLPVHLYGNPVPMTPILDIARAHRLSVIEDCAQAYGATCEGKPVGSFGDIGCFSFYPTKNLGAWGDGGMCVTKSGEHADALRLLRNYGIRSNYLAEREGMNSRLDEVQAAILLVKMRYREKDLQRRRTIALQYDEALRHSTLSRPEGTVGGMHCYHLYVVQAHDRAKAMQKFEEGGITTLIHYPTPIHRMPAYAALGYSAGSLPVTEEVAAHLFSIPLFPHLTEEETQRICACLASC